MVSHIRHYQARDLNALMSAWESASKAAHPFLSEPFLETERYNIPDLYIPNADTWVIEVEGNVVGFMALIGNEVGAIFVDPQYHGLGLGRALMDKACSLHSQLELEVFKENTIGQTFYEKYGFTFLNETFDRQS